MIEQLAVNEPSHQVVLAKINEVIEAVNKLVEESELRHEAEMEKFT